MRQLTLRIDEQLALRLKRAAFERGESVNSYAGAVLGAAVDPQFAGSDAERLRERLARAGLLAVEKQTDQRRPSAAALARARRRAGQGTSVADLVSEGRR